MQNKLFPSPLYQAAFFVLFFMGTIFAAASELRTWTSTSGATVEASFVRRDFSHVVLKKADGKMTRIPYHRLSLADQQYVTQASKPGADSGVVAVEVPPKLEELFGESLYNAKKKKVSAATLKDKVIGVYFSASWCPPCRAFTPELVKTYNDLKESGKPFEVVFVSSDRDRGDAFDYMKDYDMPWLMVKYGSTQQKKLKKLYGSTGIPHLKIINDEGEIVSKNGRGDVSSKGSKAYKTWSK